LGGGETVRGYRRDEAIGRRFWSLQNEVWLPVPAGLDWVRRNLKLAPFFDAGGVYQAAQGGSGVRRGAGGGLRIQAAPGLFLKVDYGYGSDADPGRRRGRVYVSADMGF
jgi:hemolysin activation/secretion protein